MKSGELCLYNSKRIGKLTSLTFKEKKVGVGINFLTLKMLPGNVNSLFAPKLTQPPILENIELEARFTLQI